MTSGPKPRPALDRVLDRTDLSLFCWHWRGGTDGTGYGMVTTGSALDGSRRPDRAHRVVYEALVGPIPVGYDVHHLCRDRRCVNPEHLVLLSHGDHAHEHAHAQCKRCGSEDWYFAPSGYRRCRTCRKRRRTG